MGNAQSMANHELQSYLMTDSRTAQLVVVGLAAICLAALGAVTYLLAATGADVTIPGAVATGALGALGAILATTRTG